MSSGKNKKINILVVEDSPTQAEHLKLILEKAGYNVSVARNGKEALSLLETTPQEMVISDIVMPEMDGYELCRTIKQDERFKQIPVILVTVLYDPQDVIRGLECGANNFISKPYDEKYLLSRIEVVLASSYAEETEKVQIGLEISFAGKKHHINASRLQILNMLLSTYETAVQKNQELTEARDQLRDLNEHLEDLVAERTLQLENTNRQLLEEIEVRKKTKEALQRKTRAYQMISECNQFIFRTLDEQDLVTGICKILVTSGGYRSAWVGYVRHDKDKNVEPVAQSGFEQEHLKNLRISWKKGHHGKGPTGTAIRTGNPIVIHDIPNNPKCGSWSSEAIQRDYSTVAAFPLIIQEQVIGALTIYSSNPEAFDSEEMNLLSEMTGDLAFGIASIRTTIERKKAEEKIESLAKFPEENPNPIFRIAHDGILLFANKSAEFILNEWRLSVGTKVPEFLETILKEGIESGSRLELEKTVGERTYLFTIAPIIGQNYVNLYGIDITDRKKAEDALRESEHRLTEAQRIGKIGNWEWIPAENKVIWSAEMYDIFGIAPKTVSLTTEMTMQAFHPEDRAMVAEATRKTLEELKPQLIECRILKPDGTISYVYGHGEIVLDANGKLIKMIGIYQDITERKRADEALRETNEYLHKLIDFANAPIIVWDPAFRITRFNEAFEHLSGRTEQEVLGQKIDILFPEESREASLALIKKTLEGERWESLKIPLLAADGTIHTLLWNSANILTADAELVSTIAQGIDITQSERAEEALRESESRYRSVVEDQTEFICRFTPDGKLTFVNEAYCRHFGLKREECIGKRHSVVLPPDDVSLMKEHIRSLTLKNPVGFIEHRIIMPSGEVQWQRWSDRAIFDKDGHVVEYQSVGRDITDHKQMEEEILALNRDLEKRVEERTSQLNKSLEEKVMLLKEIHHRVKNNLQIVASLLNLQSRYIRDESSLTVIRESQNRVKAMALVHEKLYRAEDISHISLHDYIRFLGTGLFQFYDARSRGIQFSMDISDVNVDIDAAIPLGLILNELISNSLKYAFPEGRKGEVAISVKKEGHTITVLFRDNGIGIPAELDWRDTQSLGLRLVNTLVDQMNGTIELDRTSGTRFTLILREKEQKGEE